MLNIMIKQPHGMGNYGKQRFKESMMRLSEQFSDKEIHMYNVLGYTRTNEQKQTK